MKLMCKKIPAESTRGLTGAPPHLQIHREVELNDWTWQLGRGMLSLINLPCRITQPRQGQGTAYRTNTALHEFSAELYATKGISDTKKKRRKNLEMVPYKCTNPPRSLGHIAQALFCPVTFGRCSGTSVCTSSLWYRSQIPDAACEPLPGCHPRCAMAPATEMYRLVEHQTPQTSLYLWRCTFATEAFLIFWVWMMEMPRAKAFEIIRGSAFTRCRLFFMGSPCMWEEEPADLTVSSNLPQ